MSPYTISFTLTFLFVTASNFACFAKTGNAIITCHENGRSGACHRIYELCNEPITLPVEQRQECRIGESCINGNYNNCKLLFCATNENRNIKGLMPTFSTVNSVCNITDQRYVYYSMYNFAKMNEALVAGGNVDEMYFSDYAIPMNSKIFFPNKNYTLIYTCMPYSTAHYTVIVTNGVKVNKSLDCIGTYVHKIYIDKNVPPLNDSSVKSVRLEFYSKISPASGWTTFTSVQLLWEKIFVEISDHRTSNVSRELICIVHEIEPTNKIRYEYSWTKDGKPWSTRQNITITGQEGIFVCIATNTVTGIRFDSGKYATFIDSTTTVPIEDVITTSGAVKLLKSVLFCFPLFYFLICLI